MNENEIIKELTEVGQRAKSNTRRLDRMEARQDNLEKLTNTVATMQVELKNTAAIVGETRDAVKNLQSKPGRRWDALIAAIFTALAGLVVGFLFRGV